MLSCLPVAAEAWVNLAVQLVAAVLKAKVPLQTDIMQAVFLLIPMLFPMTPQ